jgi:hypothetical protein
LTLKEIKKAVNSALKERYPEYKIYGADTIEGYTRPSFFVYITQTFSESTKNARHKNVEVEIYYIQKAANEADGTDFFTIMEEMFGQKLTVGSRSLNTSDMELTFQGENANVPMCRFDVEFWDRIERQENVETMKILMLGQEVKD